MQDLMIDNVRLVTEAGVIDQGSVLVREGRIARIRASSGTSAGDIPTEGLHVVDGQQQVLIPGMIDVHIHGAQGHDMMDGTRDSIEVVSRACAATGCTTFLVTSVSSSLEALLQLIDRVREVTGQEPGARIAGIHAEGPYLNVRRKGMQNEAFCVIPA
ncbi:amidohydrolase family protein [Deinococcus malanensis]|uniref:amidohydrolase family protein n=1 Tax=Deinococcus malanensis TaxID=1706855 RepID=UPI00363F7C1C